MQVCLACSATTDEAGRFCPACGAVLAGEPASDPRLAETDRGASDRSNAASLIGTTVDGFTLEGILGGGAFGTVYRGRQVGLDRVIAIKVPTHEIAADPVMARRFAREARAASRVDHPGVITIYAVGELPDGRPYIAMQLFDGVALDKILAEGPLPAARALEIARQVASALTETHAAGVVHRDLKPSNIVWRRDRNGDDRIALVDFGIAVSKPGTADATRLTAGGLIGTPHYMSPEQAHGDVVDARADLYALGCILFELLTGTPPFEGSGFEVLLAHLGRPVPAPSELEPSVPPVVDAIVARLTAKKPDDRLSSADALVAMIDDALDELDRAKPAAPKPRAKRRTADPSSKGRPVTPRPTLHTTRDRPPARLMRDGSRLRWFSAGAAGALLVAAVAFTALHYTKPSEARDRDPAGTPVKRVELFRDDGETRLRVWIPEEMPAGRTHRIRLELRNKLGARLAAEQVVVTIEEPGGKATGVIARPRSADPDQYGFPFLFEQPGTYKIRVFPPETTSTFDIAVPVTP